MPLSDDAMAVRAGINRNPVDLQEDIFGDIATDGPVLSVWCADAEPGESREQLLIRICQAGKFPNGQVQVGRLGDIRAAVVSVERYTENGEPPEHHHATFDDDVPLPQVEDFVLALGEPELNPDPDRKKWKR